MVKDGQQPTNPRSVSRGLKLQDVFIAIDSLYVVVEYPHKDLFLKWVSRVGDLNDIRLYDGIAHDDFVIRRGLIGYKLSIWQEDARLLLTDRVDESLVGTVHEGHGMGVMLQLGPKWLRRYGDQGTMYLMLNILAQLHLMGVKEPEKYPIRLNRVDVNIDAFGLKVSDFSTDEWRKGWVGFAKKMTFHTAARTRDLQGLSIGSSEGAVRFKIYDKVLESAQRGTSRFWRSVWGVAEDAEIDVARFEWSIKCYEAKFHNIQYLASFTEENLRRLLNYVVFKWGRLCIPQADDTNQSRWPLAPIWEDIQAIVTDWNMEIDELAHRDYDYRNDLSPAYINSLGGWLAGSMVRVGLEQEEEKPVDLTAVLIYLQENGLTLPEISKRATDKWQVKSKLNGENYHEKTQN